MIKLVNKAFTSSRGRLPIAWPKYLASGWSPAAPSCSVPMLKVVGYESDAQSNQAKKDGVKESSVVGEGWLTCHVNIADASVAFEPNGQQHTRHNTHTRVTSNGNDDVYTTLCS